MIPIIRDYLRRQRWQILGWGLSLALLAILMLGIFASMMDQLGQFGELMDAMPPALFAALGMQDAKEMLTPMGFISLEFFSFMPLILGILAISLGSGLLVSDEEEGLLDLLMAHPLSRTTMFGGRVIGMLLTLVAVVALPFLAMLLNPDRASYGMSAGGIAGAFLSLLAVLLFFATLALLLSFVLPARRLAAAGAGAVLIAAFFMRTVGELEVKYELLARLSPLSYYQGGQAIAGLNLSWIVGLLAASLLFTVAAGWLFQRRDLRVGGEGGGLSLWRRRPARAA